MNLLRRTLTLVVLTLSFSSVLGQIEFAPLGARWIYGADCQQTSGWQYFIFECVAQQNISGKTCQVIRQTAYCKNYSLGFGCSLADTSVDLGDIYLYKENNTIYYKNGDQNEFLPLFKFRGQVTPNDTIPIFVTNNFYRWGVNQGKLQYLLFDIDTVSINGKEFEVQSTRMLPKSDSTADWTAPYFVIENILNAHLLLGSPTFADTVGPICGYWGELLCYEAPDFTFQSNLLFEFTGYSSCSQLDSFITQRNEMPELAFKYYPNPSARTFTIELESNQNSAFVTLYDLSGREVKREILLAKRAEIEVSDLPEGIYALQIVQNAKRTSKLLVIQR